MDTGQDVLERLAADPATAGLVMDFDGVLAPIVEDPAASRLLPGTAEVLERLAARLGVLALVSGRPAAFLAERAPVPGALLLGAYGVEQWADGAVRVLPEVEAWRPRVADARAELERRFDGGGAEQAVHGVLVEDKGLAVAVHWRRASDRDAAGRAVQEQVAATAARTGLHREPGKLVEELRPPVQQDKGTALRRLAAEHGLRALAYAGDDRGDLPAFAAVLDLGGAALVVHGADTAPEVAAVAGTAFDGPETFAAWLRRLADALA